MLARQNRAARPVGYVKENQAANASWASRKMALLGILTLFFIVVHMKSFWYEMHFGTLGIDANGNKAIKILNEKFDENFVNELKQNMPDIVYIYSQNSASSFLNFIKIYQTENLWMNTNLMCIGEKTSSILNEIKWKKIFLFNPALPTSSVRQCIPASQYVPCLIGT